MQTKKKVEQVTVSTEISPEETKKRRPGRQPMTPAEKETAAQARAVEKEKAANLKPDLFVQYQDSEVDMASLVEAAKADFRKAKKRTLITAMRIYFKPDEHVAYYVINENFEGKVSI